MAKLNKKQEQAMQDALENAQELLEGAELKAYSTSFTLDYGERTAVPFQLNGAVLMNKPEYVDIVGNDDANGTFKTGSLNNGACAYILDALSESIPWLCIDSVSFQKGTKLFSLSAFIETDDESKADAKADAKKRAVMRLLNTESTASELIKGAKRAGGRSTLDALYKQAIKKDAKESTIRNYIYTCWSLHFEPAFMSSCATPDDFSMWAIDKSNYTTKNEYIQAMDVLEAYVRTGEFENGKHEPEL